jgi:hypothetical protein
LLTRRYPIPKKQPKPRKKLIPASLAGFYRPIRRAISRFQDEGKTLLEVCEALNAAGFRTRTGLPFRHSVQVIKIARSFPEEAH